MEFNIIILIFFAIILLCFHMCRKQKKEKYITKQELVSQCLAQRDREKNFFLKL